jgi:hypothetical protein
MHVDHNILPGDSVRAVETLAEVFEARSTNYALIGGLAFVLRGRPRFTQDVDVLLEVPQLVLPGLLQDLTDRGFDLDQLTVIKQFVQEHMTSFQFGRVRIDWLKPVLPLYSRTLAYAVPVEWTAGRRVRVATAEGLILTKMVAFRPQDQLDIDTLLTANRDEIDIELIREEWAPFAATEPERTAWLENALIKRVIQRD